MHKYNKLMIKSSKRKRKKKKNNRLVHVHERNKQI